MQERRDTWKKNKSQWHPYNRVLPASPRALPDREKIDVSSCLRVAAPRPARLRSRRGFSPIDVMFWNQEFETYVTGYAKTMQSRFMPALA